MNSSSFEAFERQVSADGFEQWFTVFRQAAIDTLPEEHAKQAIGRTEHMSESFRAGLFHLKPIRRV